MEWGRTQMLVQSKRGDRSINEWTVKRVISSETIHLREREILSGTVTLSPEQREDVTTSCPWKRVNLVHPCGRAREVFRVLVFGAVSLYDLHFVGLFA
jgi:hypothetical protein